MSWYRQGLRCRIAEYWRNLQRFAASTEPVNPEGGEAMKVVELGDVCPTVQILKHG